MSFIPAVVCLLFSVNSCYAGVWEDLHEGGTVVSRKWFLLATSFRVFVSGSGEQCRSLRYWCMFLRLRCVLALP